MEGKGGAGSDSAWLGNSVFFFKFYIKKIHFLATLKTNKYNSDKKYIHFNIFVFLSRFYISPKLLSALLSVYINEFSEVNT